LQFGERLGRRQQRAGYYGANAAAFRVRLVYKRPDGADHMHPHHGHGGATPKSQASARLLVFLTDASSGGSIPYMPVSAKIDTGGKALTVKLSPSFGREGFHYDAPVSIPADAKRITLTIGPTTMRLDQGAPESLKRAQTVAFDLK